jgi:hypothetical protein
MSPTCFSFVCHLISHRRLFLAMALPLLLQALTQASIMLAGRTD